MEFNLGTSRFDLQGASDEEEPSLDGKKGWQRVKWSDSMVRLLITAVSYISEEAGGEDHHHRKKMLSLHKKGKWKSVSKVMAERGHFVSPQQCEDKFNDLNKRYKRLNEILGRGTSCEVVENPSLLDMMDHVSNKEKEEVRKILSSKHLYYEEMCSYHNGNRLHLPPDPELHHSLRLALMLTESSHEDAAADHDSEDLEDFIGSEQNNKRAKKSSSQDFSFRNSCFISLAPNQNNNRHEGGGTRTQSSSSSRTSLQLEEQRFHIQEQMLELENERLKWQQLCQKQDRELEMMKLENQRMKMENEQMALELKRKEMGIDNK